MSLDLDRRLYDNLRQRRIEDARAGKIVAFTKHTFPGYEVSWHHLLTGKVINMFIHKKIRRLIIEVPPRHGKSELTSRRLPALWHGIYPNDELMMSTYNSELAGDMITDVQRIMDTDAYREIFPNSQITREGSASRYSRNRKEHELVPIVDEKTEDIISRPGGSLRASGIGGSYTGRGAQMIGIDDPFKNREEADSEVMREAVWKFYTSTLRTRLEGEGSIIITMTRWHSDDLVGRLLDVAKKDKSADQWVVLRLPAIKENHDLPYDSRAIGEALWPEKFPVKDLMKIKASIGDRDWSSLYQQNPVIEGGNIIKSSWIKYYGIMPEPSFFDEIVQSWDFAVKAKATSDYTVGQVWGRKGPDKFLLDQVRGRYPFPQACAEVVALSRKWPRARKKYIEAKANGPAVIDQLRSTVSGFIEVEVNQDKVARLNSVAVDYQAGNVWYPAPQIAPWITEHVNELTSFPLGRNDDQVDTASQALNELRGTGTVYAPIAGHTEEKRR